MSSIIDAKATDHVRKQSVTVGVFMGLGDMNLRFWILKNFLRIMQLYYYVTQGYRYAKLNSLHS